MVGLRVLRDPGAAAGRFEGLVEDVQVVEAPGVPVVNEAALVDLDDVEVRGAVAALTDDVEVQSDRVLDAGADHAEREDRHHPRGGDAHGLHLVDARVGGEAEHGEVQARVDVVRDHRKRLVRDGVAVFLEPGHERGRILRADRHRLVGTDDRLAVDHDRAPIRGARVGHGRRRHAGAWIGTDGAHRGEGALEVDLSDPGERLEERVVRELDEHLTLNGQHPDEVFGVTRVLDLIPERRLLRGDRHRHAMRRHHGHRVGGPEAATARFGLLGARHEEHTEGAQGSGESRDSIRRHSILQCPDAGATNGPSAKLNQFGSRSPPGHARKCQFVP